MAFEPLQYDLAQCINNIRSADLFAQRLQQQEDDELKVQMTLYVNRQRNKAASISEQLNYRSLVKVAYCWNIIHTEEPLDALWPAVSKFFHRDIKPPEDR